MFGSSSRKESEMKPLKEEESEEPTPSSTAVGEAEPKEKKKKKKPWVLDKTLREKEIHKWERLAQGASTKAPPAVARGLIACAPFFARCVVCCEVCVPIYAKIFGAIFYVLSKLPTDLFGIIWGLCLVFFGGMFPLTLSAYEAFRQCGGEDTYAAIHDLSVQFQNARIANQADDEKDEDGDGIADVEQIGGKELIQRKSHLLLSATDPTALDRGFKGVYSAWTAVIAVLKIQFAQMIALGAALGDFLASLLRVPLTQILVHLMEPDIHKWIPNVIGYVCKIIAIIVAYKIQQILSAFYSAMRGGLMVTRSIMAFVTRKKWLEINPDETFIDEISGWLLAAVGFYFQFSLGFGPPFFVTILLWPLSFCEGTLLWAITSAPPVPETAG